MARYRDAARAGAAPSRHRPHARYGGAAESRVDGGHACDAAERSCREDRGIRGDAGVCRGSAVRHHALRPGHRTGPGVRSGAMAVRPARRRSRLLGSVGAWSRRLRRRRVFRHARCAVDCDRRQRRADGVAGEPWRRSQRRRIPGHLTADRRRQHRRCRFVDRRQRPCRPAARDGSRLRCTGREVEVDVGSHATGKDRRGERMGADVRRSRP